MPETIKSGSVTKKFHGKCHKCGFEGIWDETETTGAYRDHRAGVCYHAYGSCPTPGCDRKQIYLSWLGNQI